MKYYCDGIPVGDWFGIGRYPDIPTDDAARLSQALRRLNAGFFLVRSEPRVAALAAASGDLFESIYANGDIQVFRVRASD
jgi:hypothetical protein